MAQMNRNVNLEEIDSDALFGIDALKNQTIFQKIIFFGTVLAGVGINVALPLIFHTPRIVCILIFLALLLVGVAFGCNYEDDMTYGKYMYCFFFKPKKIVTFQSTEDIAVMKEQAVRLRQAEEMKLQRQRQASPEAQRKLMIKVVVFVLVLALAVVGAFIYAGSKDKSVGHHTVNTVDMNKQ